MAGKTRSWWGWGNVEDAVPGEELPAADPADRGDAPERRLDGAPRLRRSSRSGCRPSRVRPPEALAALTSEDPGDRLAHSHGQAFRDVVRALLGRLPPSLTSSSARPREAEVAHVLDWCSDARIAVIPFGGGSSVVGGVEPRVGDDYAAWSAWTSARWTRCWRSTRPAGRRGCRPACSAPTWRTSSGPAATPCGSSRSPSSSPRSGGWLATRAGGHFATVLTHIDDLTESLRVVTPAGLIESRRLPGSGAGPSPDRMFLGSEGTLGVITQAWMRLQDRPRWRAGASVALRGLRARRRAVRAISQSGLHPANCRLLDPVEALINAGSAPPSWSSASSPPTIRVTAWMERALELCRDHGGVLPEPARYTDAADEAAGGGAADRWRSAFLRMPYQRDALAAPRHDRRDLRDRLHLGPLRRPSRSRRGRGRGRDAPGGRRQAC